MLNFNYREVVLEVMSQSVSFLVYKYRYTFFNYRTIRFHDKMVKNEELFIKEYLKLRIPIFKT